MFRRIPKLYASYFLTVCVLWATYIYFNHDFISLFKDNWVVSLTMVFGSLIAGASSEGGGAIAFPVFTLLLDISPEIARNFSFAIQSIGMAAASLVILGLGIKVDKKVIVIAAIGGGLGLVFGTFFLRGIFETGFLKLFFVSLWLSFGVALYLKNKNRKREILEKVLLTTKKDMLILLLFSFMGGLVTAFLGSGVDIFTFCLLTLYYNISESIATPTSVVIMTIITIIGFFLHVFIVQDFQYKAFEFWLCSIPIVIVFAPIGAVLITKFSRQTIFYILLSIIIIQYIGAIFILKPTLTRLIISGLIILSGSLFFSILSNAKKNQLQAQSIR